VRNQLSIICSAAITTAVLLGSSSAHAQSPAWRCTPDPSNPNLPECQDALINDIELIIDRDWPFTLNLAMPALPYTCNRKVGGGGGQLVEAGSEATANFTNQINWSISLASDMRWFLIGQHTANTDVLGTVTPFGFSVTQTPWSGTGINYLFGEAPGMVMAGGQSTGVTDLGPVLFQTPSGALWSGNLRLVLNLADGKWDCIVGPSGLTVRKTGTNVVVVDYPLAWTPIAAVIAEGIREQFRRAVRIAVTGSP
jgi:hypothetical protein